MPDRLRGLGRVTVVLAFAMTLASCACSATGDGSEQSSEGGDAPGIPVGDSDGTADIPSSNGNGGSGIPVDTSDTDDEPVLPTTTSSTTTTTTTTEPPPTTTTSPPPPCILPGDVLFATDSAELKASALPALRGLARQIQSEAPEARLRIVGHTDSRGTPDYNRRLSERRAESVKAFFVSQGFARGDIRTEGAGESNLLADDTDASGRFNPTEGTRNRRVAIFVLVRGQSSSCPG